MLIQWLLSAYPGVVLPGSYGGSYFSSFFFFQESPHQFSQWLHSSHASSTEDSSLPHPCHHVLSFVFLMLATLPNVGQTQEIVLICVSLMTKVFKHLSKYLLATCESSFEIRLLSPLVYLLIRQSFCRLISTVLYAFQMPLFLFDVQLGTRVSPVTDSSLRCGSFPILWNPVSRFLGFLSVPLESFPESLCLCLYLKYKKKIKTFLGDNL